MNWRNTCYLVRVEIILRRTLTAVAVLGLMVACSTTRQQVLEAAKGGKVYAVVNDQAAFYRYGPQQGNGPDSQLSKDTLVKLIRPSFGYSKVQLLNGDQQGYVASEDIRIAPPALIAAATATPPPVAASGAGPRGERFDLNSNDPRLVPLQETLPPPDLPPASASESAPGSSPPNP